MADKLAHNDKPRGELTVRISAMPGDTNANGDIFGGWVLSRMDQAGGIALMRTVSSPRGLSLCANLSAIPSPKRETQILQHHAAV